MNIEEAKDLLHLAFTERTSDDFKQSDFGHAVRTVLERLEELEAFVRGLNSLGFGDMSGNYGFSQDGEFWLFDLDGNGIVSGKDALDAWEVWKEKNKDGK